MATDTATVPRMTAEEFFEWLGRPGNERKRFEFEGGRVIERGSPAEHHRFVCWVICSLLLEYVARRGSGYACTKDRDHIVLRTQGTVRGPDLSFWLRSRDLEKMGDKARERVAALFVEVLSHTDRHGKTTQRVGQYHKSGVALVWLVDPEDRLVTVYRPNELPQVLDESDDLTGDGVLPDFRCRVADLFTLPGPSAPPAQN
jgi:Uma2 family endonuclease